VLVDANILLYAVDETSPFHQRASNWLTGQLNGARRVGFPWQSLVAFLRISTHERASARPLTPEQAAGFVADWLEPEVSWIPREGPGHGRILTDLITRYQLRGNIVSDAHLAALAIEHGLEVCSNDADFARFSEVRWTNPVTPDLSAHDQGQFMGAACRSGRARWPDPRRRPGCVRMLSRARAVRGDQLAVLFGLADAR
jgi:toxin-antitoxin system PIN domain toxin